MTNLVVLIMAVLLGFAGAGLSLAEVPPKDPPSTPKHAASAQHRNSDFSLGTNPTEKRSYWWPSLVSIPLPGFGQWYEQQYTWGALYTGVALTGVGIASQNVPYSQGRDESDEAFANRNVHGVRERRFMLGLQTYQAMGGMSAYHSFRTAVRSRQQHGEFLFLTEEETTPDIMAAAFDFRYLSRPTTFIPLLIAGGFYVMITEYAPQGDDDIGRDGGVTGSDAFFATSISFNAGTHEEAVFRGWVQPMTYHLIEHKVWANVLTSSLFAALHLSADNQFPLVQALLGYHLGAVTIDNSWKIGESVFIHTWWDVIVFLAAYQIALKDDQNHVKKPPITLPPFELRF